ncbi:asparagine synthase (glutamine-hydrolyzing) [bacterium]|nr:asparagine synthase (glutamine-hydrolyzing) [bacterium]
MCGILGQISLNKSNLVQCSQFKRALDLQEHRGPDDSDIYEGKRFIFGHRRLSVIDLSSHAKQPMRSDCGNFILVFNGEIYNYLEIKNELIEKGHSFKTSSDTEVLLHAFIEYGIDCIKHFIGMFAFCIHDKRAEEYYIVRDRLGVKPLYFSKGSDKLVFASEIKSILELDFKKRELDYKAVSSYVSFRYPILDNTFFKGIYSLAPAHYIKLAKSNFKIIEYWNVIDKFKEQKNDKGEAYYQTKLSSLLESSVKYRMISDVPFGAFLSGGVDSSIVTALMAKNSPDPIKTFTIGFEEEGFNEFEYANIVADKYGTNHKEIVLSGKNYIKAMEKLILFKDAPLSVPNEVPLYLMSKELKKNITVVLSGEGADEIFGGYGRIFRSPHDFNRMKELDASDLSKDEKEKFCINFIRKYLTDSFDGEVDHFMNIYSYTTFKDKKELLNNNLPLDDIEKELVEKITHYFNELGGDSYYNKLMYAFEKVHIVGLLQRVDTATMAASVEARTPFVDHRLVEFAFTIPLKYKLKWISKEAKKASKLLMSDQISETFDIPKYILKKTYEGIIPNSILYRKKIGFPVPINNWFGGHLNKYAKDILLSQEAKNRGIYNTENIKKWLDDNRLSADHSSSMKIWMLLNLELFNKAYFSKP